jgi:hypothetical protein
MKKITYTLAFILVLFTEFGYAQLTDGSTAADFTFTDMNGVSQNLYTYLNQGKFVALDISATWCGPCWEYHSQIKTMEGLYQKHDSPGDKKWKILFVEGDPKTSDACMTKSAGCTGTPSQGNWLSGTLYPMCNPPGGAALTKFTTDYKINFFPSLYLICPNKKVYGEILNDANLDWPTVLDWENVCKKCGTSVNVDNLNENNTLTIYPNPATENVGVYFNLKNSSEIKLQVLNSIGQIVDEKDLGVLSSGNQSFQYITGGLQKGLYFFIISSGKDSPIAKKVVIE